jgi:hypothetical protein
MQRRTWCSPLFFLIFLPALAYDSLVRLFPQRRLWDLKPGGGKTRDGLAGPKEQCPVYGALLNETEVIL